MISVKKMLNLLWLTAACGFPATLMAEEDTPWYRVELLVFSQNQDNLISEFWDRNTVPGYSPRAYSLRQPQRDLFVLSGNRELPVAKSSMRKQGYRMLFHRVWNQAVYPKQQARPLRIVGGDQLAEGEFELDGEITIDIARYLHLRTSLFYTQRVPHGWQSPLALPAAPEPGAGTELSATDQEASNPDVSANTETPLSEPALFRDPTLLSVQMKQGRRMRRDELHYLDHPMFGLLIKATRIDTPDQSSLPQLTEGEETPELSATTLQTPVSPSVVILSPATDATPTTAVPVNETATALITPSAPPPAALPATTLSTEETEGRPEQQ